MQKLLSLPPNLVEAFSELEHVNTDEWFCTSDPVGMKLGSGGGTTWLLRQWEQHCPAGARVESASSSMPADRADACLPMPPRARY